MSAAFVRFTTCCNLLGRTNLQDISEQGQPRSHFVLDKKTRKRWGFNMQWQVGIDWQIRGNTHISSIASFFSFFQCNMNIQSSGTDRWQLKGWRRVCMIACLIWGLDYTHTHARCHVSSFSLQNSPLAYIFLVILHSLASSFAGPEADMYMHFIDVHRKQWKYHNA